MLQLKIKALKAQVGGGKKNGAGGKKCVVSQRFINDNQDVD